MNSVRHCQPTSERGSVLIYALMVVTFLAGLAAYLATFSDPVIHRSQDAQRIIKAEYTTESVKNIVESMCQKDVDDDTDLQNISCSVGANDTTTCTPSTSDIKEKIASFINKYKYVYIYNNSAQNSVIVGAARLSNEVSASNVSINFDNDKITSFSATPEYEISYALNEKITQHIKFFIEK